MRGWSVDIGANATVRKLSLRLFGPPGDRGLAVDKEHWLDVELAGVGAAGYGIYEGVR
ncbi:hypothetical protein [Frankia sp. ACN1ag]|uniref:hypothetical protein n=1 Tax=Frankia sp. ACN1ag TaxID=102891 RepID=UPI00137A768C|nr:hypothetical protein [Frankia sp. ACN1ag]